MKRVRFVGTLLLLLVASAPAAAHITPPVVLMSDREAVIGLLAGSKRFFVREVKLSDAERQAIRRDTGWSPEDDLYRFYIGRDEDGKVVAATIFLTEYTVHGPVRVVVALGRDGKVKGATVVELTEETYPWVKPLLDQNFARAYVGQDSRGTFAMPARGGDAMSHFYGEVIASLIKRAAVLYDSAVVKRGDAG